ncbi:hypothetical protein ACEPPN_004010 [Leptodophora sp. 'Broadleaf-Isolate-01']
MKLFLIFASIALAAKPVHVALEGNVSFGSGTLDSQRQTVHDKLRQHCLNIGANENGAETLTGGFDNEGYHFKYICNCAHGDVKLPYTVLIDSWWSAQATYAGQC